MAETSQSEEANALRVVLPAYTNRTSTHTTHSPFPEKLAPASLPWNLLTFLSIAQSLKIDFLPITWAPALMPVDHGGTSEIRQSLVNVETAFVYKRLILGNVMNKDEEERAFQALIAEVTILGQERLRTNKNLVQLEGVCWDVYRLEDKVLPVFVFEKAEMGNLVSFMKAEGKHLGFGERVELCVDVGTGIRLMHSYCEPSQSRENFCLDSDASDIASDCTRRHQAP